MGDIDERGRLPAATALATGAPSGRVGANEKSVSSLLRKKPAAIRPEPNTLSTVVVMLTALPSASTMTKCEVPAGSFVASGPASIPPGGVPASAAPVKPGARAARAPVYPGSSSPCTGTRTKPGSPTYRSRSAYISRCSWAKAVQASALSGPRAMSGVRSAMASSCSTATPLDGGGGTQIT